MVYALLSDIINNVSALLSSVFITGLYIFFWLVSGGGSSSISSDSIEE